MAVRNPLLEKFSGKNIFFTDFPAARKLLSLPRFGHLPAREMAAGKSAPPSGTLLDFSSETATAFLSFSDIFLEARRGPIQLKPRL